MEKSKQIYLKRITAFTKAIITLFFVSLIIFLNFIDLRQSNEDRDYLQMLKDVSSKSEAELGSGTFELKRVKWLLKNAPSIGENHVGARDSVVSLLNEYGYRVTMGSKGGGNQKNTIIMMSNDSAVSRNIQQPDLDNPSIASVYHEINIRNALQKFNNYGKEDKIRVLTYINPSAAAFEDKFAVPLPVVLENRLAGQMGQQVVGGIRFD